MKDFMKKAVYSVLTMLLAAVCLPSKVYADRPVTTVPLTSLGTPEAPATVNYKATGEDVKYTFTVPSGRVTINLGFHEGSAVSWGYHGGAAIYTKQGTKVGDGVGVRDKTEGTDYGSFTMDITGGEYYILIDNNSESSTRTSSFVMTTTFTPSAESYAETYMTGNNDMGYATPYTLGTTVTGQLAKNDDDDYYKFATSGKGTLTVSVTPTMDKIRFKISSASDSSLSYEENVEIGRHSYTYKDVPKGTYYISFSKGSWVDKDTGDYTFSIASSAASKTTATSPQKITLKKPANQAGRKMVVKWAANSKMSGYEIQIATNRGFSNGVKKYTVSSGKTSSKTIKSLKKGKTYYVRIRSYVKVSGKKKYSAWSSVKSVKIKK